jgi:hypothetical protein
MHTFRCVAMIMVIILSVVTFIRPTDAFTAMNTADQLDITTTPPQYLIDAYTFVRNFQSGNIGATPTFTVSSPGEACAAPLYLVLRNAVVDGKAVTMTSPSTTWPVPQYYGGTQFYSTPMVTTAGFCPAPWPTDGLVHCVLTQTSIKPYSTIRVHDYPIRQLEHAPFNCVCIIHSLVVSPSRVRRAQIGQVLRFETLDRLATQKILVLVIDHLTILRPLPTFNSRSTRRFRTRANRDILRHPEQAQHRSRALTIVSINV